MENSISYTIFVHVDDLEKYLNSKEQIFTATLIDNKTQISFDAKIVVSQIWEDGYNILHLKGRGAFLAGDWFVKVIERIS